MLINNRPWRRLKRVKNYVLITVSYYLLKSDSEKWLAYLYTKRKKNSYMYFHTKKNKLAASFWDVRWTSQPTQWEKRVTCHNRHLPRPQTIKDWRVSNVWGNLHALTRVCVCTCVCWRACLSSPQEAALPMFSLHGSRAVWPQAPSAPPGATAARCAPGPTSAAVTTAATASVPRSLRCASCRGLLRLRLPTVSRVVQWR